jgi:glycosyltransferase involved in cell wall biosynthesis
MLISVLVCTMNRAASLKSTLLSIRRAVESYGGACEVVIIDNGSTDETAQVLREVERGLPQLRWVVESKQGLSRARNRGLSESRGDIILFTDDDVRVPPDWIHRTCRRLLSGEADAVVGGVRLAPHLERPWLVGELRGWVACTDVIDAARPRRMVGANMAFTRRVLERVPAFDVELGSGALGFHDETLFTEQLLLAGYRITTALDTTVEHHPMATRVTQAGLLQAARLLGRSSAYLFYHWRHGQCRWSTLKMAVHGLLGRWHGWRRRLGLGSIEDQLMAQFRCTFHGQYVRERCRERNYDKFGLVKRRGAGTSSHEALPAGEKVASGKHCREAVLTGG